MFLLLEVVIGKPEYVRAIFSSLFLGFHTYPPPLQGVTLPLNSFLCLLRLFCSRISYLARMLSYILPHCSILRLVLLNVSSTVSFAQTLYTICGTDVYPLL